MITKRTVQTDYEVTISREELLRLLANEDVPDPVHVPSNASVTIAIPTGGDYSGMDLDLADAPISIRWTERTTG